jgi:uroporphyrinogen decarboxylase
MSSKEQVKKAIRMEGPEYVPLFIFDGERNDSDIIQIDCERFYMGEDKKMTEWGFKWDNLDPSIPMGAPSNPPIDSWDDFEKFKLNKPNPFDKERFSKVSKIMAQYGPDRYYMGSLYLTGFTIMSYVRGFCDLMEDLYINRDKVEELADLVFGVENDIIRQMKDYGFDGVSLWDDWGTQENLLIRPELWREVFKPRYKQQVELAHKCGLDVFFHTCGYVYDIIPDLIEVGFDMLNLGQPDVNGIERVGENFGGKICFASPVSYQTTGLSGTKEEIYDEVKRLVESTGRYNGGLIAFIINYEKMGMSRENYESIVSAFKIFGKYR